MLYVQIIINLSSIYNRNEHTRRMYVLYVLLYINVTRLWQRIIYRSISACYIVLYIRIVTSNYSLIPNLLRQNIIILLGKCSVVTIELLLWVFRYNNYNQCVKVNSKETTKTCLRSISVWSFNKPIKFESTLVYDLYLFEASISPSSLRAHLFTIYIC